MHMMYLKYLGLSLLITSGVIIAMAITVKNELGFKTSFQGLKIPFLLCVNNGK